MHCVLPGCVGAAKRKLNWVGVRVSPLCHLQEMVLSVAVCVFQDKNQNNIFPFPPFTLSCTLAVLMTVQINLRLLSAPSVAVRIENALKIL